MVCSDIIGNRDLIEDAKGGYLVDPSNSEGFANSIRTLAHDQESRKTMGDHNLMKVREFDIKIVLSRMREIYHSTFEDQRIP